MLFVAPLRMPLGGLFGLMPLRWRCTVCATLLMAVGRSGRGQVFCAHCQRGVSIVIWFGLCAAVCVVVVVVVLERAICVCVLWTQHCVLLWVVWIEYDIDLFPCCARWGSKTKCVWHCLNESGLWSSKGRLHAVDRATKRQAWWVGWVYNIWAGVCGSFRQTGVACISLHRCPCLRVARGCSLDCAFMFTLQVTYCSCRVFIRGCCACAAVFVADLQVCRGTDKPT